MSLPVPGIPAGRDNGICTSGRDSDVTTPGIIDAIGGDAADLFLRRDLCQQIRQSDLRSIQSGISRIEAQLEKLQLRP